MSRLVAENNALRSSDAGLAKVSFILGTRPEAIKLAPLIHAVRDRREFQAEVCITGQHREMLQQVLDVFDIVPDRDLSLMQANQTLAGLTSRAIAAVNDFLAESRPELVMVQGDTTTVFCAALAAFYHGVPVGHVEAGLRTWDKHSPFPEEINRVLTSRLADLHFAPTESSKQNLLQEQIAEDSVFVTGNTVIDALMMALAKVRRDAPEIVDLPAALQPNAPAGRPRVVLVTGHRRENFGQGLEQICTAIGELAASFPDTHFVYPVHLNPNVRGPIYRLLGGPRGDDDGPARLSNIHLIEPLGYLAFVAMMDRSSIVLTDSGGVQEEAPSLGKPVLVMRDVTERPEAVEMGTVRLVGTSPETIISHVSRLLTDAAAYDAMANAVNPYGDGRACERIVQSVADWMRRRDVAMHR